MNLTDSQVISFPRYSFAVPKRMVNTSKTLLFVQGQLLNEYSIHVQEMNTECVFIDTGNRVTLLLRAAIFIS